MRLRIETAIDADFLARAEAGLASLFHERLLAYRRRRNASPIRRVLDLAIIALCLAGLAVSALLLAMSVMEARPVAPALGLIVIFLLVLIVARGAAKPDQSMPTPFRRYWRWLANTHARRVLKNARKLAPFVAEYDFRDGLAAYYRTRDGKSALAWTRNISGYSHAGNGFTVLFKKEHSIYPYAIVLHGDSQALGPYLDGLGVKSVAPPPDPGFSAGDAGASAARVSPAGLRQTLLYGALGATLLFAAISWGPKLYFAPASDAKAIEIFTTTWCGYCAQLREFMRANGIPYRETDVERSLRGALAMRGLASTGILVRGVPFSTVGPHVVYGLNQAEIEKSVGELGYRIVAPFNRKPARAGGDAPD